MTTMDEFHDLPEEERHRQLENMARAACLALWPDVVDPQTISELSLSTNALYTVSGISQNNHENNESSSPQLYVLRITDSRSGRSRDDMMAECLWLESLKNETNIMVRYPIRTKNGDLFGTHKYENVPHQYVTLFEHVPGERLEDHLDTTTARLWGRLLAELHHHASTFSFPHQLDLVRINTAIPGRQEILLNQTGVNKFISSQRAQLFGRLRRVVEAEINSLWKKCGDPMLIHYDLHGWNVLVSKTSTCESETDSENQDDPHYQLAAIDFEDLVLGHRLQDVVRSLNDIRNYDNYQELRDAFQSGYQEIMPWPESNERQIQLLMLGQQLSFANFIVHHWDDDEDIEEELVDLEEAIKRYFTNEISTIEDS